MRIDKNKVWLFSFHATTVVESIDHSKQIISTHRTEVLYNQSRDAVKEGNTKVSIRTGDTDVVVLAVTSAQHPNNDEVWTAFGTGKCCRFI